MFQIKIQIWSKKQIIWNISNSSTKFFGDFVTWVYKTIGKGTTLRVSRTNNSRVRWFLSKFPTTRNLTRQFYRHLFLHWTQDFYNSSQNWNLRNFIVFLKLFNLEEREKIIKLKLRSIENVILCFYKNEKKIFIFFILKFSFFYKNKILISFKSKFNFLCLQKQKWNLNFVNS